MCGATRHMMDDGLIVEEHQVDGTQLLIIYIFIHRCIYFFAILVSQVRCYCNLYLLSFIVIMYWTKFLYELYVLIHYIEGHYFIFCVNNWLSYLFILCYLNSFLYLQIQLYDTSLSLSPSCALDIVL